MMYRLDDPIGIKKLGLRETGERLYDEEGNRTLSVRVRSANPLPPFNLFIV